MKSPLIAAAFCVLLTSCSEPPKPKEPEKVPLPVTGRYALQQMFVAARTWAQHREHLGAPGLQSPASPAPPTRQNLPAR